MGNVKLTSFASADEVAAAVASAWLDEVEAANRAGKPHSVALSGGRIVKKFYSDVVNGSKSRGISLARVQFFWGDERCVPPDDPESNFRLARELLFEPLKIGAEQIHRIRGEEPDTAAESAVAEISRVVPFNSDGQPVLDIIFLGTGEDGHVASLFPSESPEVRSNKAVFRTVIGSKPPPKRVTLGYAAIAAARQVWVMASGAGKEASFRESMRPGGQTPLAHVLADRAETLVFSDIRL